MTNEQTLTFAALYQVAKLVQNIARTGQVNQDDLTILLNSTLVMSPDDTIDVYGGNVSNLTTGLNTLVEQLGRQSSVKDPEITRYIINLLALEKKLSKSPQLLAELGNRLTQAQRQTDHYAIDSDTLLASLASIYSDVISPIGNKIQISGDPAKLKQIANQHKIRALLLAGIRSAVLWRQVGGKKRNLIFARAKVVDSAQTLLSSPNNAI